ncbi:ATP-dependent Clp protease proteolytic subunit [Candidatus Saccharibacteria bacterium]|nr:ATP-dependent Clp protease proteolytic subunit [Candidatus Saccharibacteria bacterium]
MNVGKDLLSEILLGNTNLQVSSELGEFKRLIDFGERRLFLNGTILSVDNYGGEPMLESSVIGKIVENILKYNEMDKTLDPKDRKPIKLFINSPGGEVTEGFSLVSVIEKSKTPVYTINIGEWSSMAFIIGIVEHKRFSFPYMTFLMHDGTSIVGGSTNKVWNRVDFDKKFEREVVKRIILRHSNLEEKEYDDLSPTEYYMLPEDALKRNFIDKIIDDIDEIL